MPPLAGSSAPPLVQPAHLSLPPSASTAGPEAAEFAESVGMFLDPEQRLVLDAVFAEAGDGLWAAFEVAVICARQNMKTHAFEAVALADVFLFGAELVVWSAHEFSTALESFRSLKHRIEGYDHLRRRVKRINESHGEEAIELHSGARIKFRARTRSGGRGLSGDRVILDEALMLQAAEMGSLLPTLSARPNPQVVYGSSAGLASSAILRGVRDRGRAGNDPSLAYLEWCAPPGTCAAPRCDHRLDTPGCALDDEKAIRAANPALGRRIDVEHIRAVRRALASAPLEFARERLGWWSDPDKVDAALPLDAWADCRDREHGWKDRAGAVAPEVFAVDVAADHSWTAIATCGARGDGLDHVEVIDYRAGTEWVVGRLVELRATWGELPVVIDGKGPVRALLAELLDAGIEPVEAGGADYAQACGNLVERLLRRSLRHIGQGELDTAVRRAVRRPVVDGFVWSRRQSPVEIAPLVAVTLALWHGRRHVPPPPKRRRAGVA